MKKIVIFILCFVLFTSFLTVQASEEGNVLLNDGGYLRFLSSFGIIDHSVDGNSPVTRAEFAKMFYRIMINCEVPEYSDFVISFTDVNEAEVEAVRMCKATGIMNGISESLFGSENNVTYLQAIKAMVSFLGYDVKAESLGGWPSGYSTLAANFGLLRNPPKDFNAVITYNGIAEMFRYAAEVSIMETIDNKKFKVDSDKTYLDLYYKITRKKGVITANSITNFDGKPVDYGKVALNGETILLTEKSAEVAELIGQSVYVFVSEGIAGNEIVYYEKNSNKIIEIYGSDILTVSYTKYTYSISNTKEGSINIDPRAVILYNNSVVESYNNDILNPFAKGKYDGSVKLIDNTNDNVADVVFIEAYETMVVGAIKDNILYSRVRKGNSINIGVYPENSVNVVNVKGEPILPSDIAVDDVLTYYRDLRGNVTQIYVTIQSTTGEIEEVIRENDIIRYVKINGIEYECSNGVNLNQNNKRIAPGMYVTVYFDRCRKISDMEAKVFDGEIGLLVDCAPDGGLSGNYNVKIYGTDAKFRIFKLAEKIFVNDSYTIKPENFINYCGVNSETKKIVRQIIKYSTNIDGELKSIYIADPSLDSNGDYVSDFFIYKGYDGTNKHRYTDVYNCFDLQLFPGDKCRVFVAPLEEMRDNEELYSSTYKFSDGENVPIIAYGDNKNSPEPIAVLYVTSKDTSVDIAKSREIFAVNKITQQLNEENEVCYVLNGWYSKSSTSAMITNMTIKDIESFKTSLGGRLPEEGDIIKIAKNFEGKADKGEFVFDMSEDTFCGEYAGNPNVAYNSEGHRFIYGDVVYSDDKYITIEIISDTNIITYESYPISRFKENGVVYEKPYLRCNGQYRKFSIDDIYSRVAFGDSCSKAIVFSYGKYWINGFIINK